jgi:hypothetical protein
VDQRRVQQGTPWSFFFFFFFFLAGNINIFEHKNEWRK